MYELRKSDGGLRIRGLKSHLISKMEEEYRLGVKPRKVGPYFHVRDVGECPRGIILRFCGVPPPPIPLHQQWRMAEGVYLEARASRMYEAAGLVDATRIRKMTCTYPIAGWDVSITGVVDLFLQHDIIVEVKSTSPEKFSQWKTLEDLPRPYQDQGNLYLGMSGCADILFHLVARGEPDFRIQHAQIDVERNWYHLYRFAEIQSLYSNQKLPESNHNDYWCAYGGVCERSTEAVFNMSGNPPAV